MMQAAAQWPTTLRYVTSVPCTSFRDLLPLYYIPASHTLLYNVTNVTADHSSHLSGKHHQRCTPCGVALSDHLTRALLVRLIAGFHQVVSSNDGDDSCHQRVYDLVLPIFNWWSIFSAACSAQAKHLCATPALPVIISTRWYCGKCW